MSIFGNESKQRKNELIQLQNIVLEINEKKLQVSEEFLDKMTKIYISKYMKVVNEQVADLGKLTNIGLLFKKYDIIMSNLDELIKIEPLYKFNKPTPSEYKAQIEGSLDDFVNALISREWRKIKPINGSIREDPMQEKKFTAFFDSFAMYENRLPETSAVLLKRLKDDVFPPKEDAPANLNDAQPDESGFTPETFETVEMPENPDSGE